MVGWVLGREEALLERTDQHECVLVIPSRLGGDADVTFSGVCSCHSNDFHCNVKFNLTFTIQKITNVQRVTEVDLVL